MKWLIAIVLFLVVLFALTHANAQRPEVWADLHPYEKAVDGLNLELKKFRSGSWQMVKGGDFECVHVSRDNLTGARSVDREILRDYIRVCRYGAWSNPTMMLIVAADLVRDGKWTSQDWQKGGFNMMQYVPLADGSYRAAPACYGCKKPGSAGRPCE